MSSKCVFLIISILSLSIIFCSSQRIQTAKAYATIYIRANGAVDPQTPLITSADNTTYSFTADISDQIIIERSNVIINGTAHTLQGTGVGNGFTVNTASNITIRNVNLKKFTNGISLALTTRNTIVNNGFQECGNCINLLAATANIIDQNVMNNPLGRGIVLDQNSDNNTITQNAITNMYRGIWIGNSRNNTLHANTITNSSYSIHIWGSELSHYMHDIDTTNTKDSETIFYVVNQTDQTIKNQTHPTLGYLALVNCNRMTVQNLGISNNGEGILLAYTNNSLISNSLFPNNYYGIKIAASHNNVITQCTIVDNLDNGIELNRDSDNNTITQNIISNSAQFDGSYALFLEAYSDSNMITDNTIANNPRGIWLGYAASNSIHHNNIIGNNDQAVISSPHSPNFWDDGYEGNFWSNYIGQDYCGGIGQNETGSDGTGDTPYMLAPNNLDNHPLVGVVLVFSPKAETTIRTISNSTIASFHYNGTAIRFNVSGQNGTEGFCRLGIPTALLGDTYKVFVNDTEISYSLVPNPDSSRRNIYFAYDHSTQDVVVTPEYSSHVLPTLMATIVAVVVLKRAIVVGQQRRKH